MTAFKIKDILFSSRKMFFWIGNSLFWTIILLESVIINPDTLDSFYHFLRALNPALSGFAATFLLRIIFKKFQIHKYSLFPLFFIVLIYSIFASLIWTYSYIIMAAIFYGYSLIVTLNIISHLFEINFITISLWCGLYLGYKIWEEWNNQKLQLENEKTLVKTAQLEMLKYQLNPHFLFNTLSSLRSLITIEPARAKEMVTQISEFLRYSLLEGKNNEVQLIKEIEIIKLYLNIEQVRYNEDLIVEFEIAPETKDSMIPIFLIHPLVENAVKHGMQTSKLPLKISVSSKFINGCLVVEVKNSGKWIEKSCVNSSGLGLQNIQKRLAHSYPDNHLFEITKEAEYVIVKISINYTKR